MPQVVCDSFAQASRSNAGIFSYNPVARTFTAFGEHPFTRTTVAPTSVAGGSLAYEPILSFTLTVFPDSAQGAPVVGDPSVTAEAGAIRPRTSGGRGGLWKFYSFEIGRLP